MSLDAVIRSVEPNDVGLTLHLEPRYDRRIGHWQPFGQRRLTIANPTWTPEPGMPVWGGDSMVEIGHHPGHRYHREHYTQLREMF